MTGHTVILSGERSRAMGHRLVELAPAGAVLNVREATRTTAQSDKMWAMIGDISRAKPEGRVLPPDVWKCLFMASCGHKVRFEPDLEGNGVVPIGFRSSRLTKAQMSDLIETIAEYGARHNVQWSEPAERKAA